MHSVAVVRRTPSKRTDQTPGVTETVKLRWGIGLLLVLFGALILSNSLGLTTLNPWSVVTTYFWPVVFIVIGLLFLVGTRIWSFSRVITGLALLAIGVLMVANQMGLLQIPTHRVWSLLWPVVVILFGLQLLSGARKGGRSWAIMSGISRNHPGWNLRTADYWALMGGIHLDLRKADIPAGQTTLQITTVMGGTEIIVPEGLNVICQGTCILGGMQLFGRDYGGLLTTHEAEYGSVDAGGPVVHIHCSALMGGMKVFVR